MKTVQINVEVQYLPILLDALQLGYITAAEEVESNKAEAVHFIELIAGIGVLHKQIIGTVKEVMPDFYNYIMDGDSGLREFNKNVEKSLEFDAVKKAIGNLKIMGECGPPKTKFDEN